MRDCILFAPLRLNLDKTLGLDIECLLLAQSGLLEYKCIFKILPQRSQNATFNTVA